MEKVYGTGERDTDGCLRGCIIKLFVPIITSIS